MIEEILVGTHETVNAGALRVEPAQERSLARIDALLDAAATVVDEVGFDRLTTAQVAELSGASIGTVYRYFPDRIALLVERFAAMFRTEPGFRIMRFEEVRGVDESAVAVDHLHEFAERLAGILVANYGFDYNEELVFRLDIACQMAQSLIERSYLRESKGDERVLAEAGIVAIAYLEKYYS